MKRKELIEQLQKENPDEHIAAHIWCAEDIKARAIEDGTPVTDQEANDIVDLLDQNIDCEYGITWGSVGYAIEEHVINR